MCYIANAGLRDDWKKYTSKENGRKRFQVDLEIGLMEFGIRYDWGDVNDPDKKPKWMRQMKSYPCDCKMCFFCKEGFTDGIYHKPQQQGTSKASHRKRKKRRNQYVQPSVRDSQDHVIAVHVIKSIG